jgi:hypothetical protein
LTVVEVVFGAKVQEGSAPAQVDAPGVEWALVRVPSAAGTLAPVREDVAQLRAVLRDQLAGVQVASAAVTEQLSAAVSVGMRLSEIGGRLRLSNEAVLAALEQVAFETPAGSDAPAGSLTEAEEAVLRRAGSLTRAMPALEDRASFRTQLLLEQLVASALTVKEAASRLDVSDGRIRQRLTSRSLVGFERGGAWRLPAFQFTEDGDLPGLADVLPAFPDDVHPAAVLLFLDIPTEELELDGFPVSPRTWLITGGSSARVAELVRDAYEVP